LLSGIRYTGPIFGLLFSAESLHAKTTHWFKLVVTVADRLHFLVLRITVEWCVTAKKEVGNDTDSPNVNRLTVSSLLEDLGLGILVKSRTLST
jgi:hypothetical protein